MIREREKTQSGITLRLEAGLIGFQFWINQIFLTLNRLPLGEAVFLSYMSCGCFKSILPNGRFASNALTSLVLVALATACVETKQVSIKHTESGLVDSTRLQSLTSSFPVLNGIDVLVETDFEWLVGKRVGLITNHTGIDRFRHRTIDLLMDSPKVDLRVLFSPEHGVQGVLDSKISDSSDQATGLKVYSLYGQNRAPQPEQLKELDILVFDIQDIGARFYTYISTMGLAMQSAADAEIEFLVLDRVNPIRGDKVEGPMRQGESDFVAFHNVPVRHGMTTGELAKMFKMELDIPVSLKVIRIQGWNRSFWFDETGLPWINTSPNMRSLTQSILYPGIGLLETTHLSVGRGTDTPFERIGAPYINDLQLAEALNRLSFAGIRFVPIVFKPDASVYKGQTCQGVGILLTNREIVRIVDVGIAIARTLYSLYPEEFGLDRFNRLLKSSSVLSAIRNHVSTETIVNEWNEGLESFKARRQPFLLY